LPNVLVMNHIVRQDRSAELELTRLFRAPVTALWRCWTEPQLIAKWWAPSPVLTRDVRLDLRQGGRFSITLQTPDGAQDETDYCILGVTPLQEIILTDVMTAGYRPASQPDLGFTAIIRFEAESGGARYTAHLAHANVAARARHEAMGFHESWGIAASQLGALAESL
jgi:uncharacterized protein YndB with AHSA1/START domain